jgi:2-dehydropantoate 2-reductase
MHFVILGAGALGSILAGHLARAGHRVQLVARGARAAWLTAHGLCIRGLSEIDLRCEIVQDPALLATADVFVNTVKTYDSAAGLAGLGALHPSLALSVQNGVIKEDELAARFGAGAVLGAMADFSGELTDDGTVLFTRNINLHLGELDGTAGARAADLAAAIAASGINARAVADIRSLEWSKYTGWLALMLLSVLVRRPTGDILSDPDAAWLAAAITRETAQLADALGIPLVDISPVPVRRVVEATAQGATEVIQEVGARLRAQAPAHRMSSLQDLLRGRRLELEETVGHALREAQARGLVVPTLSACYRLVAAINRGLT